MADHFHPRRLASLLFIVAIAMVFTLQFGPGSRGCEASLDASTPRTAAIVNGAEIPVQAFRREYSRMLQGQQLPEEVLRQLQLPKRVLERLIDAELLSQAAARAGIRPTNEEVLEVLKDVPDFQKDGQFDFGRYNEVLSQFYRRTPAEFEDDIRKDLASNKLLATVEGGALVSDDEVRAAFLRENNTAEVTFARFLPSMYAAKVSPPKPDELARFKTDKQKDISAFFDANQAQYSSPEQVRLRQLFVRVAGLDDAAKTAAREKLAKAREEIAGGKDFGEVAKTASEDPATKDRGGELGWVDRTNLPAAVADRAFALKAGELSEVIESPSALYVVKAEERREAQSKSLKDVEDDIAKQLYNRERALQLARAEAEKTVEALKAGKKLAALHPPEKEGKPALTQFQTETRPEAVPSGKLDASTTEIPYLGEVPDLLSDVFAAESPKALTQLYPTKDGFAVVEITARAKPDPKALEGEMDKLRDQARAKKKNDLRESYLEALRKGANIQTNDELISQVGSS